MRADERALEGPGALKAAQAARRQGPEAATAAGRRPARRVSVGIRAGFGRGGGRRLRRSGCLRRDGGRRRLRAAGAAPPPLRGLLHHDAGRPLRGGLFPAREHAQGRRREHRQQQAQKREHPQPENSSLGRRCSSSARSTMTTMMRQAPARLISNSVESISSPIPVRVHRGLRKNVSRRRVRGKPLDAPLPLRFRPPPRMRANIPR